MEWYSFVWAPFWPILLCFSWPFALSSLELPLPTESQTLNDKHDNDDLTRFIIIIIIIHLFNNNENLFRYMPKTACSPDSNK